MIDTSQIKKGVCLVYKDQPMMVVDVSTSTPTARGGNTITKTKLRNLLTGQLLNESFRGGETFPEVDLEQRPCSVMYCDGTHWHFMDGQSYEQFQFTIEELGEEAGYLKDGLEELRALVIDGEVVSIKLPMTVDLQVVETDPAIKGATAKAQLKPAKLETGLVVQVPPYLSNGEVIRVDTRDGHFVERVKN